jgi:hypothetical protein
LCCAAMQMDGVLRHVDRVFNFDRFHEDARAGKLPHFSFFLPPGTPPIPPPVLSNLYALARPHSPSGAASACGYAGNMSDHPCNGE